MLTNQQQQLLNYLQVHKNEWLKLFDIVYALADTYHYNANLNDPATFLNSVSRRRLTKDIQAINDSDDVDVIIISNTVKGIKIANEEEFDRQIKKEYSAVFRKLRRIRKKERKGRKAGQMYISDNGTLAEVTPFEQKPYGVYLGAVRKEKGIKAQDVVTAMKAIDNRFDGSLLSKIENGLCLPTEEMAMALTILYTNEREK